MWGNRLGWQISAGIVVITLGIYGMLIFGTGISKPTQLTLQPGAMDPITIPGSPRSLIPAGDGGDGTALYREALEAYRDSPATYDPGKVGQVKLTPAELKKLKAVQLLLQASDSSKATLFATKPEEIVRYGVTQHEAVEEPYKLGKFTNSLGIRLKIAKRPEDAKTYHVAAFNLGYTMCNERVTFMEFWRGQELMQDAVLGLAEVDPDRAQALKAWPEALKEMIDNKNSMFCQFRDAIRTIHGPTIKRHAGDVFNLAKNSQDRMWRVESIMALGSFRYNSGGSAGDQRGANRVLAELAADDSLEPAAKVAVKAAQELTLAEHNKSAQMP